MNFQNSENWRDCNRWVFRVSIMRCARADWFCDAPLCNKTPFFRGFRSIDKRTEMPSSRDLVEHFCWAAELSILRRSKIRRIISDNHNGISVSTHFLF